MRAPKEAGDVPARISDGVVERRADRATLDLDVSATIDECGGDIDVIAAGRPVQRRLRARLRIPIVGVSSGGD
jgi:hypothetical protein